MRYRIVLLLLAAMGFPHLAIAQSTTDDVEEPAADFYVPATLDADGRKIASGMGVFGSNLYRSVASQSGDVAISPASVSTAFGLAYAGARGRTADEIATVLHYPSGQSNFQGSFSTVLATMKLAANGRTLAVNNAIWLQQDLTVAPAYLALIDRHYAAGLRRVDYTRDPQGTRLAINSWVAAQTNQKIRELLAPVDVTNLTRSVLVNTVYFKAGWITPFDVAQTKVAKFHRARGKPLDLPLMNQSTAFRYAEHDGVKALALPYRGGETEMVILLPGNARGLAKLEASLSGAVLDAWQARLAADVGGTVITTIPKFKIETRFDLVANLKALGMVTPFSDESDFSAMKPLGLRAGGPGDWNLKIGSVIHQVVVEVDEKGTEAAAATAIVQIMITSGRRGKPPPPRIFRADRPFLFVIRDRRTAVPLFIGRFTGEAAQ